LSNSVIIGLFSGQLLPVDPDFLMFNLEEHRKNGFFSCACLFGLILSNQH